MKNRVHLLILADFVQLLQFFKRTQMSDTHIIDKTWEVRVKIPSRILISSMTYLALLLDQFKNKGVN